MVLPGDIYFRMVCVCVGMTKHYALKSHLHTRSKKIGKPKSKTRYALRGFRAKVSISFSIDCGFHFPGDKALQVLRISSN